MAVEDVEGRFLGNYKQLIIPLSIQFGMFGSVLLSSMDDVFIIIRQIAACIYLLFLPGYLIVSILRINGRSSIERFLLSIGLSISFVLLLALLFNFIGPEIGVPDPLLVENFQIPLFISVAILTAISLLRFDGSFVTHLKFDKRYSARSCAMLASLPLLSIAGTILMNSRSDNTIALWFVAVVVGVVGASVSTKVLPQNYYPLAVLSISSSLLLSNSLITSYLTGSDIQIEYYVSSLVHDAGYWSPGIEDSSYSMPGLAILAPVIADFSTIDLIWIFKIVYPLLFSVVPVVIFVILNRQIGSYGAFLASIFLVSVPTFFMDMPSLAKQEMAEVFFVLILLVIFMDGILPLPRSILLVVFSFSMILSHYGLTYIILLILLSTLLFRVIHGKQSNHYSGDLADDSEDKSFHYSRNVLISHANMISRRHNASPYFILLFLCLTILWSTGISESTTFNNVVGIAGRISERFISDLGNTEANEGLYFIVREGVTPLHQVSNYLHILTQFAIALGILTVSMRHRASRIYEIKIYSEYLRLSASALVIALLSIIVPFFGSQLNVSRIYHITLILLCAFLPVFIMEFDEFLNSILVKSRQSRLPKPIGLRMLAIFLSLYLLINTGLAYELTGDDAKMSIALSVDGDFKAFNQNEVACANWLSINAAEIQIYADRYRSSLLYSVMDRNQIVSLNENTANMQEDSLFFIGTYNINNEVVAIRVYPEGAASVHYEYIEFWSLEFSNPLVNGSIIYDNGGALLYR